MINYIQFPPNSEVIDLPGCGALNSCMLYLNDNGVYSYNPNGGTPTKFHRKINIETVPPDDPLSPEIKVTATVSWGDSFGSDSFSVITHLMNW